MATSKILFLVAILFIVVEGKSLEENVFENLDVELADVENEDSSKTERRYPGYERKNITSLAAIQLDTIMYDKLTHEIDKYHETRAPKFFDIYPGTKWCGERPIAWGINDLGLFRNVDRCCRDQHYCSDSIRPSASKYGLTNTGYTTKYLCPCETQFFNCLKSVGSPPARDVGEIYFNSIGSQCFKEDFPIVKCTTNYTSSYSYIVRCSNYQLDTTAAKKYQFFDVPIY